MKNKKNIAIVLVLCFVSAFILYHVSMNEIDDNTNIEPNELSIGAFFYPWYTEEQWKNFKTTNTPLRGLYNSSDMKIVKEQIENAKKAGIDFFVYSWHGQNSSSDKMLKDVYLREFNKQKMHYIILYESSGVLKVKAGEKIDFDAYNQDGQKIGERFVDDIKYLKDKYFSKGIYKKIENKPIIYIYLVRDFVNYEKYIKKIRKDLDVFIIADCVYLEDAEKIDWDAYSKDFDAVTAYNMYNEEIEGEQEYLSIIEKQYDRYSKEANRKNIMFIPGIQPGYDDRVQRGTERLLVSRNNGDFMRDYWNISTKYLNVNYPIIFLTSFNEWHEGTEIEPSFEYGDYYIKLIAKLKSDFINRD